MRRRPRLHASVVATALVLILGPLIPTPTAEASNWGSSFAHICDASPQSQCVANNVSHYYWRDALTAPRDQASVRGIQVLADGSEINRFTSVSRNASDVIVLQVTRPDIDAFAWGQCMVGAVYGGSNANHDRWCYPQLFHWNMWNLAADKVNTTNKYEYIGCHEMGHTVGLRHTSSPSCMVTAGKPSNPATVVPSVDFPTLHDFQEINAGYPL